MSKRFKIILFVRFLGYSLFLIGLISSVFLLGPMVSAEAKYRIDKAAGIKRTVRDVITSEDRNSNSSFSSIKNSGDSIIPISTEYGIVIEKINANSRIVPNVNPGNQIQYAAALAQGVAEAAGSTEPGKPGNLYLFAHSTDAPWNIVRYNAVFYLLRELEIGDRVIIFKNNRRFDYFVFDKAVTSPTDVSSLTNRYDTPVLTLQTCDPPGTLLNRLIVRAKLVSS